MHSSDDAKNDRADDKWPKKRCGVSTPLRSHKTDPYVPSDGPLGASFISRSRVSSSHARSQSLLYSSCGFLVLLEIPRQPDPS